MGLFSSLPRRANRLVFLCTALLAMLTFLALGARPASAQEEGGGSPNVSIILQDAYIQIVDGIIHGKDLGTYSGNIPPPNESVIIATLAIDNVGVASTIVPVGYHYNTIVSLDLQYPVSALSSGWHTITWTGKGSGRTPTGMLFSGFGNQTLWSVTSMYYKP